MNSPNPALLAAAIDRLEADYNNLEEHHQIQAAVRERRDDFEGALGDHPRKSELLAWIRKGEASKTFEVARAIHAELQGAASAAAP